MSKEKINTLGPVVRAAFKEWSEEQGFARGLTPVIVKELVDMFQIQYNLPISTYLMGRLLNEIGILRTQQRDGKIVYYLSKPLVRRDHHVEA